ncbi:MAG TPA: Vms1/Ankzf1 family peptidyl-tRNA hydrolase [Micromonospora sp.]
MKLSFLRPLYARPGPWASVYLDASRDTEDAAAALDLRWRALREELEHQGAESATVAALDDVVRGHTPRPGDYGIAAFATGGRVVLADYLNAPPRRDLAAYGRLPHTMPLVAQRGERVSWVRVLADRTGAEVDALSVGEAPRRSTVRGDEHHPIRRVQPGGWSQSRYQRAARTAWERNAGDSAAATVELAEQVGAEVVVVAGDEQTRPLLINALPERWRGRVVQTDAGFHAPGADPGALDDVTAQAIAEVADAHTRAALDRFGAQEHVGDGLPAVVEALRRGQVDTMLIVDDPSSTERLWAGPAPDHLATSPGELRAVGVADPAPVRADAALVRALAGTDASLVLIGPEQPIPDGGVGAVLRYVDQATPGSGPA